MNSHANLLQEFQRLLQLFEIDLNSAKEKSYILFNETKKVLEDLSLVIKDDHIDCELRLFFAEEYSKNIQGFKYRYFVEKLESAQDGQNFGTATRYKKKFPHAKHYFFTDAAAGSGVLHESSHANSIALAVIGGNHLRRMCGKNFPKYFLARDLMDNDPNQTYRMSEGVENFIHWENYEQLKPNYPIYGVFIIFILAYYFGDFDVGLNFGFIEREGYYIATKIDPEHSYSHEFEDKYFANIFAHLDFFQKSSVVFNPEISKLKDEFNGEEKVLKIYGNNTPDFFLGAMDCAPFLSVELFQKLFFSPQRNRELFIALAIIINTPPYELQQDVESVLGPQDSKFKNYIIFFQIMRYEKFKNAAYSLEGFRDYYETKAYLNDEIYQLYKTEKRRDNNNNNNNNSNNNNKNNNNNNNNKCSYSFK